MEHRQEEKKGKSRPYDAPRLLNAQQLRQGLIACVFSCGEQANEWIVVCVLHRLTPIERHLHQERHVGLTTTNKITKEKVNNGISPLKNRHSTTHNRREARSTCPLQNQTSPYKTPFNTALLDAPSAVSIVTPIWTGALDGLEGGSVTFHHCVKVDIFHILWRKS